MNRNFWISPNNEEFVAKTSFNKLEEDNIILNVFWGIVFGNSYYSETIKTGTNNCKIIYNLKCAVQTWIYRTDHGLLIILQLQQIAMLAGILIFFANHFKQKHGKLNFYQNYSVWLTIAIFSKGILGTSKLPHSKN